MPRKPTKTFTDKELEIMRVIWELGEVTVKDVKDRLSGDRHYNSVLTIIRVLERKGHLVHREQGRTYIYRASEPKEKAHQWAISHLVKQIFGGSATSLVLNLVETGDLTREDIDEIRRRINSRDKVGKSEK